ncbi:GrpB family protein [Stenotrophomonas mori]|uniref:GrpB family protein n=1 Tax=Stenotrophomonas mori TaxID=2871096 RepID=A0ABT0SIY4_9GAMM|nr:GrpB family protein [Stenotrophomonas mori]MCL7715071.1 GrpB family protein [Stenotrophomonas mori]
MPPPIRVELLPHDPAWALAAEAEASALRGALGSTLLTVHHVGSTAIPGIHAKPILDLMPVVRTLAGLDARRDALQALGYAWWGELGLPGRRYCSKDDPQSGRRLVQLHAYPEGAADIARHLAFRDFLRGDAQVAAAYDREKRRCQRLHPHDSHAYGDCKGAWIREVEARALAAVATPLPSKE